MKKVLSAVILIIAVVLLIALMSGCRRNEENIFEPPEFVYLPEFIQFPQLPDGISHVDVSNSVMVGDSIIFMAFPEVDWSVPNFSAGKLFSMNIDGSNFRELPEYRVAQPPAGATGGSVSTSFICADSDGNIWVVETAEFYSLEGFDDFVIDPEQPWLVWDLPRTDFGVSTVVRKLSSDGAEIHVVDAAQLAPGAERFWVQSFAVDDDGMLYFIVDNVVIVLDSQGNRLFDLASPGWVDRLIKISGTDVAAIGNFEDSRAIRLIDVYSRNWGEELTVPPMAGTIMSGNDEFLYIFNNQSGVGGIDAQTRETVDILNWIDSGISLDGLGAVSFLPDGRIATVSQNWQTGGGVNIELVLLTKTPYAELPERTLLTLATFWMDWNVRNAVLEFNRRSTTHRIQVIEYSQFNTDEDWSAGMTRLSTEIIAGRVPDILDVSNLPATQYIARGLLEDLYPFIDADSEIGRDTLMEGALQASEINGGLYSIFTGFGVFTIVGSPMVLGEAPGWTVDEFRAVLAANPNADMPMGRFLTKASFLEMSVVLNTNEYIDWANGTVNFDNESFIGLLEVANTFPDEIDFGNEDMFMDIEEGLIPTGRQIMEFAGVSSFNDVIRFNTMFGGDIVFKGFPTENRDGNVLFTQTALAITTQSRDKDGAWSFLRTFLTDDWQRANVQTGFPMSRVVFDELAQHAMNPHVHNGNDGAVPIAPRARGGIIVDGRGDMQDFEPLTQADIDQVIALIDSASGSTGQTRDEALWNIIIEAASEFFAGRITSHDAARIIQDRAAIYVSEQS